MSIRRLCKLQQQSRCEPLHRGNQCHPANFELSSLEKYPDIDSLQQMKMVYSSVYLNGQPVGRAKNLSGTYGNLSDRCKSGDTAACDQFYRQTERAIQQYDRMYPPGWNR